MFFQFHGKFADRSFFFLEKKLVTFDAPNDSKGQSHSAYLAKKSSCYQYERLKDQDKLTLFFGKSVIFPVRDTSEKTDRIMVASDFYPTESFLELFSFKEAQILSMSLNQDILVLLTDLTLVKLRTEGEVMRAKQVAKLDLGSKNIFS